MVQPRFRVVCLVGILLLIALLIPVPVQSGKPVPCPQGIGGGLDGLLNVFLPRVGACPPTFWSKTYGAGSGLSVKATPDGGSIAAGLISQGTPCCNTDFMVLRLDGDGNIVWQKTYGGTNNKNEYPKSTDLTPDGGFVVAGYTESFGAGSQDFWVLRLDGSGNILWQKTYGGINSEGVESFVRTTSDGGFVVAGLTRSFGAGGSDAWVLRLDGNGNIVWQKTYGGAGDEDARSVQPTSDGGFIVAGFTNSFGAGGTDVWVLRIDRDGNIVWQKTYGGPGDQSAHYYDSSVQPTSDGGFVVTGYDNTIPGGLVLRLDANGNILWQKTYGGANGQSVHPTSDGGFILAGHASSFGAGSDDMWLLRLDSNGNIVWQKTYGGKDVDTANSVDVAVDGTLIVAGTTNSFTGGRFWVLHLQANGSIPSPNCSLGVTSAAVVNDGGLLTADSSVVTLDSAAVTTSTAVTGANSAVKVSKQCVG